MNLRSGYVAFSIVLLAMSAFAGQQAGSQPQSTVGVWSGPVYAPLEDWPEVRIVMEPKPAPGLEQKETTIAAADLFLLEEGKSTVAATAVEHFGDTKQGFAVAIVIDVSGSMKGEPLNAVRQGLIDFVKRAREYDAVSIATFANDVKWDTSWDSEPSGVRAAIEALQARGTQTHIYDALQEALEKFDAPATGKTIPARRRIILISDGFDEGSKNSLDSVLAKARAARIQIDSIGIAVRSREHMASLQKASLESKGVFREVTSVPALRDEVANGIKRLLNTPVATFRFKDSRPDGKTHKIGVRWTKMNTEDAYSVTLPKAEWWSLEGRLQAWQAAAIAATALIVIVALCVLLMRSRPAPVPAQTAGDNRAPRTESPKAAPTVPAARSRTQADPISIPQRKPTVMEGGSSATAAVARTSEKSSPSPAPTPEPKRTVFAPAFRDPAPGSPTIVLRAVDGPLTGQAYPMETPELWIGAAENNQIRVPGDTHISGNHCCLQFQQQTLRLYDNQSTNKTFLNDQALTDTARLVRLGDRISAGRSVFVVEAPAG